MLLNVRSLFIPDCFKGWTWFPRVICNRFLKHTGAGIHYLYMLFFYKKSFEGELFLYFWIKFLRQCHVYTKDYSKFSFIPKLLLLRLSFSFQICLHVIINVLSKETLEIVSRYSVSGYCHPDILIEGLLINCCFANTFLSIDSIFNQLFLQQTCRIISETFAFCVKQYKNWRREDSQNADTQLAVSCHYRCCKIHLCC